MEEGHLPTEHTPEPSLQNATPPPVRPGWTYVALPLAIVIAALLVAGSIWFSKKGASPSGTAPKTGTVQYTVDDLKKWAAKIKLNKSEFSTCLDSGKYAGRVTKDRDGGVLLEVSGTPSFFINGVALVGAQPIEEFRRVIEDALLGPASSVVKNKTPIKSVVLTEEDHVLGSADAPVTIVEYSDFQCPFCRNFFEQTYGTLKKEYIDTGKAKLVYRHYPLSEIHPIANKSGEAVECAAEQGKFWEMHDAIFAFQTQ